MAYKVFLFWVASALLLPLTLTAQATSGAYNIIQAADENYYTVLNGVLYQVTQQGTAVAIASGSAVAGALVQGSDGALYSSSGARITLGGKVQPGYLPATTEALAPASDGNMYGLTAANDEFIQVTPQGAVTVIAAFSQCHACPNGAGASSVIQGSDGNFYGTSYAAPEYTALTWFSITPAGTITSGSASNFGQAGEPIQKLVEDQFGNYYGTATIYYGPGGVVFEIPAGGSASLLSYAGINPYPISGLFLGSDGGLYLMGAGVCTGTTSCWYLTQLQSFDEGSILYTDSCLIGDCGEISGLHDSGLTQGSDGNVYFTSLFDGGPNSEAGVLYSYKFSPALPAPVQVSASDSSPDPGQAITLTWQALNTFSLTMQQCYLFQNLNGTITPLGKLTGSLSNNIFGGTTTVTPSTAAAYTYAVTCGGVESGFATVRVGGARVPTSTSFATNSPVTVGGQVTLTATPTTNQSVGALTGSVSYSVGSAQLGKVNLSGGSASLSILTSGIPPGTYAITATYSGDTNYLSSSMTQNVVIQGYPTAATLTISPATVTQGQTVTLRSAVSRSGISGTPAGTVAFYYGTFELGSATLTNGVATLNFAIPTELPAGSYALTAKYSGDSLDQAAISSTASLTVIAATRTVLVVSPNPAPANTAVTFTATVSEPYGSAVPSGTVTFQVAGDKLDPVTLINGTASTTLSDIGIPAANYPVTATYSGDASNAGSSATAELAVQ